MRQLSSAPDLGCSLRVGKFGEADGGGAGGGARAGLAWDILDWTLAVAPETTRAALTGVGAGLEGRRDTVPRPGDAGPTLEPFGILDSGRVQATSSEQRAAATARLAARLAA